MAESSRLYSYNYPQQIYPKGRKTHNKKHSSNKRGAQERKRMELPKDCLNKVVFDTSGNRADSYLINSLTGLFNMLDLFYVVTVEDGGYITAWPCYYDQDMHIVKLYRYRHDKDDIIQYISLPTQQSQAVNNPSSDADLEVCSNP